MASDDEARAAARRIVEQVLASREEQAPASDPAAPRGPVATDGAAAEGDPADATRAEAARPDVEGSDDARATALVDGAVRDLHADPEVTVPDDVSEARARARALVAEVLAAHEARTAAPPATEPTPAPADDAAHAEDPAPADDAALWGDAAPEGGVAPADDTTPADDSGPADDTTPADGSGPADDTAPGPVGAGAAGPEGAGAASAPAPPESTARLRARELVAAAIAEAQAREEAERAEAEAARRAEEEAAAAREREAAAARELAAALAEEEAREREEQAEQERLRVEEAERALWAEADRDAAGQTLRLQRPDADDSGPDATTPLSVAELAATASRDDPAAGDGTTGPDDDDAERTLALPVPATSEASPAEPLTTTEAAAEPVTTEPADEPLPATAEAVPPTGEHVAGTGEHVAGRAGPTVLEATVQPGEVVEPPRTGRWLLASLAGAVTLAILFPLAIRALLRLVALS